MRNAGIGEGAGDNPPPSELVRFESARRTDIGFRVETQAHHLKRLTHGTDQSRIEMFLTQAIKAGVALNALVFVDGRAPPDGIYINRFHRTDIGAVSAG